MIISRTPFRVSFFGGGTDYPVWTRERPGSVLATSINKYCYITCRPLPPFFEHKTRILYSKVELIREIDEIQHPAIRESLRLMKIDGGLEIHHDGDLPARTGLGSSSSFTVGLLNALYGLKGRMLSKMDLALKAIHVEQEMIRENVGAQDQVMAAFGGFNRINFAPDGSIQVMPLIMAPGRLKSLQKHLLLFYTGINRYASEIAGHIVQNIPSRTKELESMLALLEEAQKTLCESGDMSEFGRLLNESWTLKRSLSKRVSTEHIDDIYARARNAGALGGKLLGAGGGGFVLVFARPDDHPQIKRALSELLNVPFRFETLGSQIIFYDRPNADD